MIQSLRSIFNIGQEWKNYIGINDNPVRLVFTPLIGLLLPLLFAGLFEVNSVPTYIGAAIFSMGYTWLCWSMDRVVLMVFHRLYPDYSLNRKRLYISGTIILIATVGLNILTTLPMIPFCEIDPNTQFIHYFIPSLTVTISVFLWYESRYRKHHWDKAISHANDLKEINLKQRIHLLQEQVKPHFLFNNLNTLSYLVEEEPKTAKTFIKHLSAIYRNLESQGIEDIVTLKSEMDLLNSYIFMMKTRFGNKFQFQKIQPFNNQCYIVPNVLAELLENAIKHNSMSLSNPLSIAITCDGNLLTFQNEIQNKTTLQSGEQTGLENIRSRVSLIMNKEVQIKHDNEHFIIHIPVIKM